MLMLLLTWLSGIYVDRGSLSTRLSLSIIKLQWVCAALRRHRSSTTSANPISMLGKACWLIDPTNSQS
nr:hypothetical protein [Grapevine virus L]